MSQPYIADFELERLALGELSANEAQNLQALLEQYGGAGPLQSHRGQQ